MQINHNDFEIMNNEIYFDCVCINVIKYHTLRNLVNYGKNYLEQA